MRQIFRFSLLVFISGILILNSCKKEQDRDENPIVSDFENDELEDSLMAFLGTIKDTIIRIEDIILENGQNVRTFLETYDPEFIQRSYPKSSKIRANLTPRLQKFTFLSRMFLTGEYLVDDSNHSYLQGGTDEPAQTGLGYSWGSRDYKHRAVPRGPGNECNDLKIYGLDCSGTVYFMTSEARLQVQPPLNFFVGSISDADVWTNAFKASSDYKDLEMEDKGKISQSEMKNGDIILWKSHIGVYLYGYVYQSNGTRKSPGCKTNLSEVRGPRLISLEEIFTWSKDLGSDYKVLRVSSGDDYTLTASVNMTGFPSTTDIPYYCKLGRYIEEALINITIKEDSVILNYINNSNPNVIFESSSECKCLGMSFITVSPIEVTGFNGVILSETKELSFTLEYSLCSPTMVYNCGGLSPTITADGYNATGINAVGTVSLPIDNDSTEVSLNIWTGAKLIVRKDI